MEYLRDGMVVFDVGANNGYYYSLKIARQFRNCQVFAFEPDPRILHHLERNIAINNANNVRVIQQALSNRTGKARMTALLGASNFLVDDSHTSGATVSVESNTLDNFVAQNRIHRLDFIKVDIEGQECNFLLGAERSLARFKPLLVLELNDDLLRRSGASTASALSLLKAADYGCFKVRGSYDAVAAPKTRVRSIRKRARGWLDPAS
jgi:FkbM family methyltransferase